MISIHSNQNRIIKGEEENIVKGGNIHELKIEVGYKVVRIEKQGRKTFRVSALANGKALVRYPMGKKAVAPEWLLKQGYGLLFFKTYEDAEYFRDFYLGDKFENWSEIWRVETYELISLPTICLQSYLDRGELRIAYHSWPRGTRMAKSLKLKEKI